MNNRLRIETMTLSDIPAVYKMELEIFKDDPWPIEWFKEGVSDTEGYYFLAYFDNNLVGYCGMYQITSKIPNYCKIANLGVKSDYRNQGIGSSLLKKILDTAKALNLDRVKLEVNTKNNAVNLYKSFGFEIEEFKENYYGMSGGDAYIMWLYNIE